MTDITEWTLDEVEKKASDINLISIMYQLQGSYTDDELTKIGLTDNQIDYFNNYDYQNPEEDLTAADRKKVKAIVKKTLAYWLKEEGNLEISINDIYHHFDEERYVIYPNKVTNKQKKEEGTTMTAFKKAGNSLARGAKTAGADEAGNLLLDIAGTILGSEFTDRVQTPMQRSLAKVVVAVVIDCAASAEDSFVPESEAVSEACGLVIEAAGRDLLQPHLAKLRPLLLQLAQVKKS